MGEKKVETPTILSQSDDPQDGTWVQIECETETGAFAIITDVLPPELAPQAAPQPTNTGKTLQRRTLDDMRRLSEEIKRKRQPGG
jgi:hypothetical protein